jgi:SPX domain protein involved in polyphosphate accumulation
MLCGALLLAAVKAVRLTEFVILNVEALRKIVKKMDKPCPEP